MRKARIRARAVRNLFFMTVFPFRGGNPMIFRKIGLLYQITVKIAIVSGRFFAGCTKVYKVNGGTEEARIRFFSNLGLSARALPWPRLRDF
jgi:hypothetical protein